MLVDARHGPRQLHDLMAQRLGIYEQSGADWRQVRPFDFKVRDTSASPEALRQRAAFIADQRWFANASPRGSSEREYQIAWTLGDAKGLPLAVTYMTFPGETLNGWPAGLDDGSANPKLVMGFLPETLRFDFAKWAHVIPG